TGTCSAGRGTRAALAVLVRPRRLAATTGTETTHHVVVPRRHLRVRFPGLPPMGLVELLRAAPGDRQRVPLLSGMEAGELHDLADVVTGVAQGSLQRQRHGMRLPTDH